MVALACERKIDFGKFTFRTADSKNIGVIGGKDDEFIVGIVGKALKAFLKVWKPFITVSLQEFFKVVCDGINAVFIIRDRFGEIDPDNLIFFQNNGRFSIDALFYVLLEINEADIKVGIVGLELESWSVLKTG